MDVLYNYIPNLVFYTPACDMLLSLALVGISLQLIVLFYHGHVHTEFDPLTTSTISKRLSVTSSTNLIITSTMTCLTLLLCGVLHLFIGLDIGVVGLLKGLVSLCSVITLFLMIWLVPEFVKWLNTVEITRKGYTRVLAEQRQKDLELMKYRQKVHAHDDEVPQSRSLTSSLFEKSRVSSIHTHTHTHTQINY
eukprot:GHVR01095007.1.p1 GENE.GHVR01095007.1~~GHVR01095007.1.p1  ORF type:complete len:209 (-),score=38.49 GHVR01095007.1:20-598(-)